MSLLSFLWRFWQRTGAQPITHTLVCGASRSGKSEAELTRLVPLARAGECAIVLLDPPGTLAAKFLLHLDSAGLTDRVIYDQLATTDRVPGYDWLPASANPDLLQREAENDERIREFASVLLRRRGIQEPARTPLIEEGLLDALRLYLYQEVPVPLPWLAEVFTIGSGRRAQLLAHCTDPDVVRRFHAYAALGPVARRNETGPAERMLRAVCLSPAFRIRSAGATFDFDRFLNERGILILDGSSRGNLSRDAASIMMGALILRVIRHCRTGAKSRVVLVLDEAVSANLLGLYESQALSEAGKWGLEFHVLVQNPLGFPSDEIRDNVLQNCLRHEWFRQGSPDAARLAAEDVGIPVLDPLRVHHTEYRVRPTDAGFERVRVAGQSEFVNPRGERSYSWSWNTVLRASQKETRDPLDRYTTLVDQLALKQKELMLLRPGYRFVRSDTATPTAEYVPMLSVLRVSRGANPSAGGPRSSGGAEAEIALLLNVMKKRLPYRPCPPQAAAPDANSGLRPAASRLAG